MYYRKVVKITLFVIFTMIISSCNNQNDSNNDVQKTTKSYENSESESVTDDNNVSESSTDDNSIIISIFGEKALVINRDRLSDDIYGTGQLDNRWSLNEIDNILNSMKGDWEIDKYIGFVDSSIYYPDLFDNSENIEQSIRDHLIEKYNEKVDSAKNNIPNLNFSIKKYNNEDVNSNYIIVNDNYLSPISIILSLDRMDDNYPVFLDRTTISKDFSVKYPVIYIKFFMKYSDDELDVRYEPATLVLTADNKFYVLIDGAFYSIVSK